MKRLLLLFILFTTYIHVLRAQEAYTIFTLKGGRNALFDGFAALSVEAGYEAQNYFAVNGGAQYSTIGRVAAELRPRYFHDFSFGRLCGELLLGYASQSSMHNYVVGCGAWLDMKSVWAKLGYYHRTLVLCGDRVAEPFNICYELGVRCLSRLERWDLNLIITNCRLFEVERHYQPSFVVDAWWHPLDRLGVTLGVNYKPAGMFNITSEFYQLYANVGVCYKW